MNIFFKNKKKFENSLKVFYKHSTTNNIQIPLHYHKKDKSFQ